MSQAGYRIKFDTLTKMGGFAAIITAIFALTLLFTCINPTTAAAKSFSMGPVGIQANVQTDGTLSVSEQRTFDFDGDFSAVWWELPTEGIGGITVTGVSLTRADGTIEALEEVPFKTEWREAGGPVGQAYSVDDYYSSVDPYVFFNVSDEKVIVTLNYQVIDAINTYSDVAELYWKFVGPGWDETSRDVNLVVTLPKPAGISLAEGDVRAWGHGNLTGTVELKDDGTVVFTAGAVYPGDFAEARVAFPVDWMTGMSIENNTARLDAIIAEETAWADEANRQRMISRIIMGVVIAVSLLLVIVALFLFFRYGKEYKPQFQEKYWRDYPSDDHPAILGALWKWGNIDAPEFTATLMSLTERGVLRIDKGSYQNERGKTIEDYILSRNPQMAATLTDPIDTEVMDLLFNKVAEGRDALYFKSIELYGKKNPSTFLASMNKWKTTVKAAADAKGYFEMTGNVLRGVMLMVALVLIGIAVFVGTSTDEIILAGIAVIAGIIIAIIATQMRRRSRTAVELHARCAALRNWLTDFSNLKEAIPTDVKVWDHFLVFAVVFGVADQVIRQLQVVLPQIVEDPVFVPVYMWIMPGQIGGVSPMQSMTHTFNTTVQTAMSANSSGSGFGGGFSGGGGGGFGGGGGGAR